MTEIVFSYSESADPEHARRLQQRLQLPGMTSAEAEACRFSLNLDSEGLSLHRLRPRPGEENSKPTRVDFMDGALQFRRNTFGKQQGLAKAVGLNKHAPMHVLDATAGLGKDAFMLAGLGCRLTLLEQSAIIHCLLEDGLQRALVMAPAEIQETVSRMQLFHADARNWFGKLIKGDMEKPDVIYLDPMFPQRSKSASVKKDMTLLQEILPHEDNADELIALALQCGVKRVVLKRPGAKPGRDMMPADFIVPGKTAHFAVFI